MMDFYRSYNAMNFHNSENPNRKSYLKSRQFQYPNQNRRNYIYGIDYVYDLPKSNYEPRRCFHRKRKSGNRLFAPYAPRNTTSFIIRAKKSGGIASLVSPSQVTPTPVLSPAREVLVDSAEEEWGVDGYGSMSGMIRLRSPGNEAAEEEDHDLSRFEMIFPPAGGDNGGGCGGDGWAVNSQLVRLKEENMTLKEKVFFMESEIEDLRWRIQCLERDNAGDGAMSENASENDGGIDGEVRSGKNNGGS